MSDPEKTNEIDFGSKIPMERALMHLPPGYNSRALKNYNDYLAADPRNAYEPGCMSRAIDFAFVWMDTKEGDSFWESVYNYYLDEQDELPPLPPD